MSGRGKIGQKGFTLVEMMVAVTLLAAACAIVYALYDAMITTVSAVEHRISADSQAYAALERVNLDLIGLYRGNQGYLVGRQAQQVSNGVPFLEYLTTAQLRFDPLTPKVPLSRISYYLEPDGDRAYTLLRGESPMVSDGFDSPLAGKKVVLLDNLATIELQFVRGQEKLEEWNSLAGSRIEKEGDSRFPAAVEMSFILADPLLAGDEKRYVIVIYLQPSVFGVEVE